MESVASNLTGKIIIITAPSGAGKTSITHHLLTHFPLLSFSVSATTRKPRHNETDRKDYYFMSEQEFRQKINQAEFVEWEMVYEGKYYGTLKSEIYRMWTENKVPILDIDVKGAIQVESQFAKNVLSIFIEAPDINTLRTRLTSRGTETPETLATRLNKAAYELSFKDSFDVVIVNDVLENAQAKAIDTVQKFLMTNMA